MRKFTVTLTQDNKSGPFDIFYTDGGVTYMAVSSSGVQTTNLSSSSLASGIEIITPLTISEILVKNKKATCDNFQYIIIPPANVADIPVVLTPAPTPSPTPSPTPAPVTPTTPAPVSPYYSFTVTSANSLDTICTDFVYDTTIYGANSSFTSNTLFYSNTGLSSLFDGGGFLYKLQSSLTYVGITSDGEVYTVDSCPVIPPTSTPAPVTPAPTAPTPSTPAPVTPAPVTPAPSGATPAPVTPAPVTPAPVAPLATFTPSFNSVSTTSESSSTGATNIVVTGGTVTVRMKLHINTSDPGDWANASITIPGVGTYTASNAVPSGDVQVDFNLGVGTYGVSNWTVFVHAGGAFASATATLTQV